MDRESVSLAGICREAIAEVSAAQPGHSIEFEPWDDAPGEWDRAPLLQVMRDLLSNALSHGAAGEPVIVSVIDCTEEALLSVANRGAWSTDQLDLSLADQIVGAYDGRIDLTSDESATVFHVWLPKKGERS
jgi:signal transduction histidine kinase